MANTNTAPSVVTQDSAAMPTTLVQHSVATNAEIERTSSRADSRALNDINGSDSDDSDGMISEFLRSQRNIDTVVTPQRARPLISTPTPEQLTTYSRTVSDLRLMPSQPRISSDYNCLLSLDVPDVPVYVEGNIYDKAQAEAYVRDRLTCPLECYESRTVIDPPTRKVLFEKDCRKPILYIFNDLTLTRVPYTIGSLIR